MIFSEQYFFILMPPTLWQPTLSYQHLDFEEAKAAEMLVRSDNEVRLQFAPWAVEELRTSLVQERPIPW